jgi:hypothetical protein
MAHTTIKGKLPIGVLVGDVLHRDFEIRGATVLDNIEVSDEMDAAGEQPTALRLSTALMARQLMKLGTLQPEQITTALVRGLAIADWNHLDAESAVLEKKLLGVEQTPAATGGSTSWPGACSEASTPSTSTA